MDQGSKGGFRLKWPWNWVVCGVFIAVAGYFIGYLWSTLLAALFLWWQKQRHPNAVPQGGYCLDRTRKRLARLLWSLLYLLLAAGGGVVFFMGFGEEKAELSDWSVWLVSGGAFLLFTACFLYETYTDLRDALCPAKSRLAKSIRSQLPYPDEAPDVAQLFAMVDKDIQENGQWFDRVAIGREWVLGDDASSIPRIRGVFSRDEIKVHYTGGRRQSARIVELYIVDDRKQVQVTSLRSPSELQMAVTCLGLRAPEAHFDDHARMAQFLDCTDEAWQARERDFRRRRDQRLSEAAEQGRPQTQSAPAFSQLPQQPKNREAPRRQSGARLSLSDRSGATRDYESFTRRDVELAGEGLASGKYTVVALFAGPRYLYLKAGDRSDGRITVNASRPDPDKLRVFETKCTDRQARQWLLEMAEGTFDPDLSAWTDITKKLEKASKT